MLPVSNMMLSSFLIAITDGGRLGSGICDEILNNEALERIVVDVNIFLEA